MLNLEELDDLANNNRQLIRVRILMKRIHGVRGKLVILTMDEMILKRGGLVNFKNKIGDYT